MVIVVVQTQSPLVLASAVRDDTGSSLSDIKPNRSTDPGGQSTGSEEAPCVWSHGGTGQEVAAALESLAAC